MFFNHGDLKSGLQKTVSKQNELYTVGPIFRNNLRISDI